MKGRAFGFHVSMARAKLSRSVERSATAKLLPTDTVSYSHRVGLQRPLYIASSHMIFHLLSATYQQKKFGPTKSYTVKARPRLIFQLLVVQVFAKSQRAKKKYFTLPVAKIVITVTGQTSPQGVKCSRDV